MGNKRGLRLAVFSEDTVYLTRSGTPLFGNPLHILFAEISRFVGTVTLSSPVKRTAEELPSTRHVSAIDLSHRPYYGGSVAGFFKNLPRIILPMLRNVRSNVQEADLVMIRFPSPIGFLIWRTARRYKRPCFLYIAGDIRKVAIRGEKYQGLLARLTVALAANTFHRLTLRMASGSLVFVTGSELLEEYSPVAARCINFIPSAVSEADIHLRKDTCLAEPIRLLYVGRLVPVKGLKYLFQALKDLVEHDLPLTLWLVGDGYHRPQLESLAADLRISEHVEFRGRIPFGQELFRAYREADIFVLPSLSEGIPKTLLEAMASGLPIVTTRVGGIPDVVKDNETGLLVEPRSPEQLAQAIGSLIRDQNLRRRLISNGYAFVREHTVEKQAERMWREIRDFFNLEAQ